MCAYDIMYQAAKLDRHTRLPCACAADAGHSLSTVQPLCNLYYHSQPSECISHMWCSKLLRMEGWLEHLLYFAADAAARRDWVQAAKALDTFSACINHGAPLNVRTSCACLQTLHHHCLSQIPSLYVCACLHAVRKGHVFLCQIKYWSGQARHIRSGHAHQRSSGR